MRAVGETRGGVEHRRRDESRDGGPTRRATADRPAGVQSDAF